jgi:hypothetical protein
MQSYTANLLSALTGTKQSSNSPIPWPLIFSKNELTEVVTTVPLGCCSFFIPVALCAAKYRPYDKTYSIHLLIRYVPLTTNLLPSER